MKIKLDPVTRLEGHMKIEVEVDSNKKVTAAKSTGNMFRGFENILKGRDPRDAVHLTQRICGLCPVSHGIASVKALEASRNFKPTGQARLLRNLIQGGNYIADHILHFYHLTLLDYIQGPNRSPWKTSYDTDMRFSQSASEEMFDHYLKALEIRRKAHEMVSLFGGKIPHVMSIMPGGVTKSPTASEISDYKRLLGEVRSFVDGQYHEDVQKLASVYKDYFQIGEGYRNFISFGVFELEGSSSPNLLYRSGRYTDGQYMSVEPRRITEDIKYTWYEGKERSELRDDNTSPSLNKANAYSWIKAPRYLDIPHEAGPLARAWINGDYRKGVSVMDRHVARMLETKKVANALSLWINELNAGGQEYDSALHAGYSTGEGIGVTEAPRGALVHYVRYKSQRIENYQVVTPTCWNVSPKDNNDRMGPLEKALIGVQIQDINNPIELMRIIHSYDPCTACAVHIMTPEGKIENKFIVSTPGL
ncbi:hydrogenase large subunit [Geosporobacter subterraneus DSM 17957]|uniref:Hydrogenase large subunit n=1 Tax=Geosporobacter subterraneus DSM 17957 TaxID=1121919 RepID=A0A1M6CZ74_9FIRM|nr:nickel-dependent hydrogenase large subunit [Geosporobacter subterraneus]SHI66375.1 hydrogenase large subunit [Geosporobacter subterraneus DSM 17957]